MILYATLLFVLTTNAAFYTGINLAGLEFGESAIPGTVNQHYAFPTTNEVDYYMGKGMNIFRLPFLWERLQPTGRGPFSAIYFTYIDNFVHYVTNIKGATVIIDPHNYARYFHVLVSQKGPEFVDLWIRLANLYKNNSKVIFGLMNEPHTMLTSDWLYAANLAIAGIRQTGATNLILVPGNAWSGAHSWYDNWYDASGKSNAQVMKGVVDPGNNYAFEVHQYMDYNYGGLADTCLSATTGSQMMVAFTTWLRTNNYKGFLGEFAGGNNQVCNAAVTDLLNYVQSNQDVYLGWTWWAGGPMWGNYKFTLNPVNGNDAPQMQYVAPFLKGNSQQVPTPTQPPIRPTSTSAPTRSLETQSPPNVPQPPPPAGCQSASYSIYAQGGFKNGFQGYYSWGTYSLSDPAMKYGGYSSLSKTMQGWEGLQLRCSDGQINCLSTSNYEQVSFYVYTTASTSFKFMLKILVGSNSELPTVYYPTAYPNTWTQITVPLSFFPNLSSFNGIQIQDNGSPGYKLYIGDVNVGKSCSGNPPPQTPPPTAPPTRAPTKAPTNAPPPQQTSSPKGCNSNSNTVICPSFTTPIVSSATLVHVNLNGGDCNLNPLSSFVGDSTITKIRINTDGLVGASQTIRCGMCVKVTGSGSNPLNGTIIGFVTDICNGCGPGGMNIDSDTIVQLDVGITWNAIDCPISTNLQYYFTKSTTSYLKLQIRNHKIPIDSVEFKNPTTGTYIKGSRTNDNFFVTNTGVNFPLPLQLRITGITGEQILDSVAERTNNVVLYGTNSNAQFAGTGVSK